MDARPQRGFDRLAPASDRYASLPVADAFTWDACFGDVGPGEWYMVAFRSIRRSGVDEALLTASYVEYSLEFHRVRRLDGDDGFAFEPYDAAPAPTALAPALLPGFVPQLTLS